MNLKFTNNKYPIINIEGVVLWFLSIIYKIILVLQSIKNNACEFHFDWVCFSFILRYANAVKNHASFFTFACLLLFAYFWEFQKLFQGNLFKEISVHYFQLIRHILNARKVLSCVLFTSGMQHLQTHYHFSKNNDFVKVLY